MDCGLFQEKEYLKYNENFPFNEKDIDFCLITHNHVDHIGRLPLLVKNHFEGKIYTTKITASFARLALADSYKVLENFAKRNHTHQLYSEADVEKTKSLFCPCEFEETIPVNDRIKITLFKNGHLLGAALILIQISYPGCQDINLLFTGDYNNKNMFFDVPKLPDWVLNLPLTVIQESTYGTMDSTDMGMSFEENIYNCIKDGNTAVCMVFSLGRAQEILYILKKMQENGKLSVEIPIYYDGKLSHGYTKLYLEEDLGIKPEMKDFLPKNLKYVDKGTRTSIIEGTEQKIILTTSGMGTYGPAQMYIPEYFTRSNCLLQFTGYTAEGTLGSKLKKTEFGDKVMIGSVMCKKRAKVAYTTEFSAHAKADEMIKFLKEFKNLKLVLVNHGEPETKIKFSERIMDEVDTKHVAILNRDYFFRIGPYGLVRPPISTKFD